MRTSRSESTPEGLPTSRPSAVGRGRNGVWRSTPACASLALRASSACAGGAHEAAGSHRRNYRRDSDVAAGSDGPLRGAIPCRCPAPREPQPRSLANRSPAESRLPRFRPTVPPILFQNRMRELGYSEGKELAVEYRFAEGRPGELPRIARELVDAKVDVILAIGDEAIVAAKNATRTVPIVIIACDAVTTGFVASLARPAGNLTGVSCLTSELMPKRMAIFRELLPFAARVVVLYNPENVSKPPEAARTVELAKELGLDAKAVQFRTADDLERAFSAFATDRPDGVIVLTEQRE